ncbi:MAG: hypothetical protein AB1547_01410 [Thermodesulfobacteriota bacterium]
MMIRHAWMPFLFLLLLGVKSVFAAVGCDLNDPDRDVARLFPGSTGYRTSYASIDKKGGEPLLREVEKRLGEPFQGLFETIDVPYTIYEVLNGTQVIGYIHGVNQKGQYGGIQVFLCLDPNGVIRNFYFQKLTSKAAKELRSPEFGKQFIGLSLTDFQDYDVVSGKAAAGSSVSGIQNPVPEAETDFRASMRATKKNLILMDVFVFHPH